MTWTCPVCESEMPDSVRFCVHCGTKRPEMVACPACGTVNPSGAKFCMACAMPLGVPSSVDASSAYDEANPNRRGLVDGTNDGLESTLGIRVEGAPSDDLGLDGVQGRGSQNREEMDTQGEVAQTITEEWVSTPGEQVSETSDWATSDVNQAPKKRTVLLIGVLAAIAVIAVGVAAFAILHDGGEKEPPARPGTEVVSEPESGDNSEAKDLVSAIGSVKVGDTHDGLTHSEWGNNDGYVLKDFVVEEDRIDNDSGTGDRYITYAQVWENNTFRYSNSFLAIFSRTSDGWVESGGDEAGVEIEPLAGVPNDAVMEHATSLMEAVDKGGSGKDAQGEEVSLKDLYKEGFKVTVLKNETDASGGNVTVKISAGRGSKNYSGELIASFEWSGSDWELKSCKANADAYKANMDWLVGTWVGERHGEGSCYGGKAQPMSMEVKSVDTLSNVMKADIEFLEHCHYEADNPVESDPGDKMLKLEGVLVPLESNSSNTVTAYDQEAPSAGYEYKKYRIEFTYEADGTIEAAVRYSWGKNDDGGSAWQSSTFYDLYTLRKAESESGA